jgi:hypothetical protein
MAPRGCGDPRGAITSEGRGEAPPRGGRGSGDKNAKRMCRFGSGEVRRLDFLLRGHEGSTVKPSQPLDGTPVERKVQARRQARGVCCRDGRLGQVDAQRTGLGVRLAARIATYSGVFALDLDGALPEPGGVFNGVSQRCLKLSREVEALIRGDEVVGAQVE